MTRLAQANADRRHQVTLATPDEQLVHVPRVLAVDEEAVSLAALEAGLADQGFRVFGYRDPARALEAFHERSYDLVVTNARLRRADGLEFTARLQDLAGIEKLPVVLLDERANRSTQEAAHAAGASAYLTRPAAWTDMSAVLTDLLDGARWRRFVRYPLRLGVDVACGDRAISELTTSVARGGISISTRREVQIGQIERYRLHMPKPLPKIVVDGVVVTRMAKAGAVSILAGIRILRFLAPDGEMHWIRLIEELARRAAARANPGSER
jgi:DNA-binding response OmpR family regulator